jgi:3-oxoacyl-(acyl-carrier-protein) synthase
VAALRKALDKGEPLPWQPLERPGWEKPLRTRLVPEPAEPLAFLGHPRLRRTSPVTHYAAAAALEAVATVRSSKAPPAKLGVVACLQAGCVQYSYRFFDEALKNPATASPLLFPETVFAAPASHVAALLGQVPLACTLLGDPASFLQGLALGIEWLVEKRVEACLVLGSEETNWLRADALWHLDHQAIISGGAGAVCLTLDPACSLGVELERITSPHTYTARHDRARAARAMRAELPPGAPDELLCDGTDDRVRTHAPERAAWSNWTGTHSSPKRILGEGLMAAAAWQCVAACDAVARGRFAAANVSVVGCNQHAMGARFVRCATAGPPA